MKKALVFTKEWPSKVLKLTEKQSAQIKENNFISKRTTTALDADVIEILESRINEISEGVKYVMGIDAAADGTEFSYYLMRTEAHDNSFQDVLAKTMHDEKEFKEEVENLSKYFNAVILKEFNEPKP